MCIEHRHERNQQPTKQAEFQHQAVKGTSRVHNNTLYGLLTTITISDNHNSVLHPSFNKKMRVVYI
ncbi:Uncharacterised protein [Vibrio cholerae]|nr:Uncharacterised protein [Vibrio cholerae]